MSEYKRNNILGAAGIVACLIVIGWTTYLNAASDFPSHLAKRVVIQEDTDQVGVCWYEFRDPDVIAGTSDACLEYNRTDAYIVTDTTLAPLDLKILHGLTDNYGIEWSQTKGAQVDAYVRWVDSTSTLETYSLVNGKYKVTVGLADYIVADGALNTITLGPSVGAGTVVFDGTFAAPDGGYFAAQVGIEQAAATLAFDIENTDDAGADSFRIYGDGDLEWFDSSHTTAPKLEFDGVSQVDLTAGTWGFGSFVEFTDAAAPGNPAAGTTRCYGKTGASGDLCCRDSAGTETCMSSGSGGSSHNILSATHSDSLAGTVTRGDIIVGNATPAWSELAIGGSGTVLQSDGTDVAWATKFTDIDTDYGDETVTSTWTFTDVGTGAFGSYDLRVGDVTTPDYGGLQIGGNAIYTSSFSSGNLNLDKSMVFRNEQSVSGILEFAWIEGGNTLRAGIPESAAGNATNFFRSFMLAGPYSAATGDNHFICDTHTSYNSNIDCNTSTTGPDLFVKDDIELEGELFVSGGTIRLDSDDANQLTISATSQTSSHTFDFPDDGLVDDDVLIGDGAGSLAYASLPNCVGGNMLTYTQSTNTFGCEADDTSTGGGADVKSGSVSVTEGGSGGDVTFATAFSGTPFCTCTVVNVSGDEVCWFDATPSTTAISIDFDNQAGGGAATSTVHWICTDAGDP